MLSDNALLTAVLVRSEEPGSDNLLTCKLNLFVVYFIMFIGFYLSSFF